MAHLELAEGFEFWKNEVQELERPEAFDPYIPLVALVGMYAVSGVQKEDRTAYNWRQSVLTNKDAITGLRLSLPSTFVDSLDDRYETPLERFALPENPGLQFRCAHTALMDGLPTSATTVPENEWFLAQHLGQAEHDYVIAFKPLRLSEGGESTIRAHYPRTARLIGRYQ